MSASDLTNPLGGQRRYFSWRGHQIAYVERGQGRPVVLVHSVHATAWSAEWRRVLPALSESHRTISIDLLGFGASDRPDTDYSARLYIELLVAVLEEVAAAPAILIGASLGASYALATASFRPALVDGVVAVGPAGVGRLDSPGGRIPGAISSALRSSWGRGLFGLLSSEASMRMFLRPLFVDPAHPSDELVRLFAENSQYPGARYAPAAFLGFKLNIDLRDSLPAVTCPVLFAWGEHAHQTPLSEAQAYLDLVPQSTLATFNTGDLPYEEDPEAWSRVVLDFIAGCDG